MWRGRDVSGRAPAPGTLMLTQSIAAFFFLTIPWLNPFSPGPTPAVVPWLVTLGSSAFVLLWATRLRLAEVTAMAWLVAALLSAAMGLAQYFGTTAALGSWVNSTALGEAYANLRQRNQFATLTNLGLAALLWWTAQLRWRDRRPLAADIGVLAAAALLGVGNAASSSRTGMVQLVMLMAMVGLWGGWRRSDIRRVLLTAALAYAIAALTLPGLAGLDPALTGILARLKDDGTGCTSRLTLWANVAHLIAQKPWFGWGWGQLNFAHFITLYPGLRFCELLDNAHNLPLHMAVELGVPVALLACGAGLWLVWRARPWREVDATRQMAWTVLAVIMLHSMLEYPLWYGPFQLAAGLSVALLWTTRPLRSGIKASTPAPNGKGYRSAAFVVRVGAAILLIACTAYAVSDYLRVSQIYLLPKMRSEAYRDNTLAKIRDSWLFQNQVRFAELTTTPLTSGNAVQMKDLATALLHFSPEPRVVEKLIESAQLLGQDDEARFYQQRFKAAFPETYARWADKKAP